MGDFLPLSLSPSIWVLGLIANRQGPVSLQVMDLKAQIDEFLDYLLVERNLSQLTIRNYRHWLSRFANWCKANHQINSPKDLTLECIRRFRSHLAQSSEPLKRVTQNYYVISLRSFLRYLVKKDLPVVAPEKIELPKTESRSLKFLDRDQVERLLFSPNPQKIAGLRDRAILEMLFSTGLRVSELVRLNRDQVNLERKEFGVIGKGGRPRVVFISDRAADWLSRYLDSRADDYKPLFIHQAGPNGKAVSDDEKMRLTSRSIQRLIDKYVRQAKLPVKASPHTLRHSFATDLLMNGADLRSVQELLGHKNIATTQIYTHVTDQQLREVHKAFHSGNNNS